MLRPRGNKASPVVRGGCGRRAGQTPAPIALGTGVARWGRDLRAECSAAGDCRSRKPAQSRGLRTTGGTGAPDHAVVFAATRRLRVLHVVSRLYREFAHAVRIAVWR